MRSLRIIGLPFSWLYGFVVFLRNYCYDKGVFTSNTFDTPIVCIGNLSLGGTGKTPMTELLLRNLKETYNIAVLSRGYGRKSKGFVWGHDTQEVKALGDEPFQIQSKFPDVTVAVDANRSAGIRILESEISPELIVLDDGFQHRKVKADYAILLTAYGNLYVDDYYIPSGSLRDHKNQVKRADTIVVTKCPRDIDQETMEEVRNRLQPLEHQQVLFSTIVYERELRGTQNNISLESLKNKRITLVTGIAIPGPLVSFLEAEGIIVEHLSFRDHHFFSTEEITLFNSKEIVLTTEKDYVRLEGKVKDLYYIEMAHGFIGEGEASLLQAIRTFVN
ncbi:tetraacyldisaccharide 4'-kinase [Spongiimicrobium salis]|uniref:tetraacyldisaccharide 4'-kinase n=1 Tax=Spongiimicrobium salis TaxID=1667022 RepID=UPI00374DEC75